MHENHPSRDVFDAIADPTRRRLIELLAEADEMPLHELTAHFPMGRTAVSKHLAILREAGLVLDRKVGRETRFRLNASPLSEIHDWAASCSKFWRTNLMRLDRLLEEDEEIRLDQAVRRSRESRGTIAACEFGPRQDSVAAREGVSGMTRGKKNSKIDPFFDKEKQWNEEFAMLREIALACEVTEAFKWMHPCYTYQDKNVVLIHGFKDYCALLFHKGALLQDPYGILVQQTENVQAARQIRFTNAGQIDELRHILKAYIEEAIEVEKAGLEVTYKKNTEYVVPEELQLKFDEIPDLKGAFEALTPGRQRAYLLHFSQAKQSKTRAARVAKYVPHILNGKGIDD